MFHNPWENNKLDTGNQENNKNNNHFFKVKNTFFIQKLHKYFFIVLVFTIVISAIYSGFFIVEADEQGIILRFGKYNRTVTPGLSYKLPEPFEKVEKVSVTRIKKETIGKTNTINKNQYINKINNAESFAKESQMLTGDENIIDMHYYIQWQVINPLNFLFNIKHSTTDNIVKTSAESIMREVIGKSTIAQALSERRLDIEYNVRTKLQILLDNYNSGIKIISVGILYSYVAPEVRDAYSDVQSAKADREKFINQATSYSNEILPQARGDAKTILQEAEAYKETIINKAQGESRRFEDIYKAYKNNEIITKQRIYLDTMEEIYMNSTNKMIIDYSISKKILPFLQLNN